MKKKQMYGNQKPLNADGDANGPVKVYYLNQDELAYYRNLKPPTNSDGKKLRRPLNGGGVA
jgi:hypothetical protein